MPELPEVESVKRDLERGLTGRTVFNTAIIDAKLRRPIPNLSPLHGRKLLSVTRRAKYLILDFSGLELVMHLGMTGRLLLRPPDEKHDRAAFYFDDNATLVFNDARRFGFIAYRESVNLEKLGVEPLSTDFTPEYLADLFHRKKEAVKLCLLEQSGVVGLGNIYVCEALFRARVSPFRSCESITTKEVERLCVSIKETLTRAVELGGSSVRDYRLVDGRTGDFQNEFLVYDREGVACGAHQECPGVLRAKQGGRSTYYCPIIQL